MKLNNENQKKIFLIYGLGKSGISSFKFLNKKNKCFVYDDNKKKIVIDLKKTLLVNQK